jgi:hypothetical protein
VLRGTQLEQAEDGLWESAFVTLAFSVARR